MESFFQETTFNRIDALLRRRETKSDPQLKSNSALVVLNEYGALTV